MVGIVVDHQHPRSPQNRRPRGGSCAPASSLGQGEPDREMERAAAARTSLSTHSRPCMRSTSREAMASPRPLPPKRRVIEASACSKTSKMAFCFSTGMPIPVSRTAKCKSTSPSDDSFAPDVQLHFPAFRELDGIAHEVDHDLAQPIAIAADQQAARRDGSGRSTPGPCPCARTASDFIVSPRFSTRSKVVRSRSNLPASILEKSRMSLISRSKASPDSATTLRKSRCRARACFAAPVRSCR